MQALFLFISFFLFACHSHVHLPSLLFAASYTHMQTNTSKHTHINTERGRERQRHILIAFSPTSLQTSPFLFLSPNIPKLAKCSIGESGMSLDDSKYCRAITKCAIIINCDLWLINFLISLKNQAENSPSTWGVFSVILWHRNSGRWDLKKKKARTLLAVHLWKMKTRLAELRAPDAYTLRMPPAPCMCTVGRKYSSVK